MRATVSHTHLERIVAHVLEVYHSALVPAPSAVFHLADPLHSAEAVTSFYLAPETSLEDPADSKVV